MANFFDQFDAPSEDGGGGRRTLAPRDRELAIRTVLGEAADQPDEGQAAVAAVIRNRMQAGRYGGENIPGVVLARHQFEPWSTQAGRNRMYGYTPESEPYQRAAAAVDRVFGEGYDPTGGATHFFSPTAQAALGRQPPRWAQGQPLTIGGHAFYAPEGRVGGGQAAAFAAESPVQAGPFSAAASAERPVPQIPQTPQMAQAQGNFFDQFDEPAAPAGRAASTTERIDPAAPRSPLRIEVTPEQPPPAAEGAGSSREPMGRGTALGVGLTRGLTANFVDELQGLEAASGMPQWAIGQIPVGAARLGWEMLTGQRGAATEAFERAQERSRQQQRQAEEERPGWTLAGELGGAVAMPIPGAAALRGAGLATRAAGGAGIGAGTGALAGAGEGETGDERLSGAAWGAAGGGLIGGGVPIVGRGVQAVGSLAGKLAAPVVQAFRGIRDVDAEAARRIVAAQTKDLAQPTPRSGLTPAEFQAARAGGHPAVVGDIGGENVRALARSAADTSPSGREAMEAVLSDRFKTQASRTVQFLKDTFKFPSSPAALEAVENAAAKENSAAYRKAYAAGRGGIWGQELSDLVQAPGIQSAVKTATTQAENRAASGRAGAYLANGKPTLEFWDLVQRQLRQEVDAARRAGRKEDAMEFGDLRNALLAKLDAAVPEFNAARRGAARFFGEENAIDAGAKFASMSGRDAISVAEARKALAQMSPSERQLFESGFLSNIVAKVESAPDGADIVKRIYNSDFARKQIELVVGKNKADLMEAHMLRERMMRMLDASVRGNSKTAQYLTQQGLAAGVPALTGAGLYSAVTGNIDYGTAIAGGLTSWGRHKIDARVAKRVGEMLASSDPAILQTGLKIVARNDTLKRALRAFEIPGARIGGQEGSSVPGVQSLGVGRAEDRQQQQ